MAGANTLEITDANFEEVVLNADVPVLLDFWAEWCAPCKALTPTMDELADLYVDRVKVGKVESEGNQRVSVECQVTSLPTVLLFKDGEIVNRIVGLRAKKDFVVLLDGALAG